MKRLITYISLVAAGVAPMEALDVDSLSLIDRIDTDASVWSEIRRSVFEDNPAVMPWQHAFTLSEFAVGGNWRNENRQLLVPQDGKGNLLGSVNARSYMQMNSRTTVWGEASFTTGETRDVRLCNTVDYARLAPFVTGDTVGGELHSKRYTFAGGYAGVGGPWSWGVQMSYEASISHRNHDPRLKIIVSDLNVDAGVSRSLSEKYTLGLGAGLEVYNQESSLDFYNPINNIVTYVYTGMGHFNTRFSGTNIKDVNYSGLGFRASLQFVPKREQADGVTAGVEYSQNHIKQEFRNYNNMPFSYTDTYSGHGTFLWRKNVGGACIGLAGDVTLARRIATENLFGTAVGNNFVVIGSRKLMFYDYIGAKLSLPVDLNFGSKHRLTLLPSYATNHLHECYLFPLTHKYHRFYTPGMAMTWRVKKSNQSYFSFNVHGSRSFCNFASETGAEVRFAVRLKSEGIALGAALKYDEVALMHLNRQHLSSASITIEF